MKIPRINPLTYERVCMITYKGVDICTLSEGNNYYGEKDWVFEFDWEAYDSIGSPPFYGIDTSLRLDRYVRRELPDFIDIRTIPDERSNIWDYLRPLGMKKKDRFEFMCRTGGEHGDDYHVRYLGARGIDENGNRCEIEEGVY